MYTETIRSKIQRIEINNDFSKIEWNHFLTMRFNLKLSYEKGEKIIERWDEKVNRSLVGRRYNLEKNYLKRMVFFGCLGNDTQDLLHLHLNVKTPIEWDTNRFEDVCTSSFIKLVENGEVHFSTNKKGYFDKVDNINTVKYTTEFRHLGVDKDGLLDTSSIVVSRNIGLFL